MKLIQITDSKPESSNSTRLKRYGLFECPVCKEHVERPLSHGKRNKSCGKRECRRATLKWTSPKNKQIVNPVKIENTYTSRNKLRFYDAFRLWYNRLDKSLLDPSITSLEEAADELYINYEITKLRYPNQSVFIALKDINKPINKENAYFTIRAKSTGTTIYENQVLSISKLVGVSKSTVISVLGNKEVSEKEYEELVNKLIYNKYSHSKQTEYLYLINAGIYTKIGVAKDPENRLIAISTGCPFKPEISLIKQFGKLCYLVERYLHIKFTNKCTNGEWFELTEDDIEYIKNTPNELLVKEAAIELTRNKQEYVENTRVYNNEEKLNILRKEAEERYIKACEKYEKQKEEARRANEKSKIETIHEDIKKWDRASQIEACTTHGMSKTEIYKAWQTMKKLYRVTNEWENFENFQKDVEVEFVVLEKLANSNKELPRVYPVNTEELVGSNNYIIKRKCDHEVKSAVAKRVAKVGSDGSIEAEYDTVTEAAKAVGGIASKISAVCKGTRKSHSGYTWKYLD